MTYTTKYGDTFFRVCRKIGVKAELQRLYYEWLGKSYGEDARDECGQVYFPQPWGGPRSRDFKIKAGRKFTRPSGKVWDKMVRDFNKSCNEKNPAHIMCRRIEELVAFQATKEYLKSRLKRVEEENGEEVIAEIMRVFKGSPHLKPFSPPRHRRRR
jgi:hypothetical protein